MKFMVKVDLLYQIYNKVEFLYKIKDSKFVIIWGALIDNN